MKTYNLSKDRVLLDYLLNKGHRITGFLTKNILPDGCRKPVEIYLEGGEYKIESGGIFYNESGFSKDFTYYGIEFIEPVFEKNSMWSKMVAPPPMSQNHHPFININRAK